jgi:hypothetical protein
VAMTRSATSAPWSLRSDSAQPFSLDCTQAYATDSQGGAKHVHTGAHSARTTMRCSESPTPRQV